jgi:hypothetical protein
MCACLLTSTTPLRLDLQDKAYNKEDRLQVSESEAMRRSLSFFCVT